MSKPGENLYAAHKAFFDVVFSGKEASFESAWVAISYLYPLLAPSPTYPHAPPFIFHLLVLCQARSASVTAPKSRWVVARHKPPIWPVYSGNLV
jgi:hypothetical protein